MLLAILPCCSSASSFLFVVVVDVAVSSTRFTRTAHQPPTPSLLFGWKRCIVMSCHAASRFSTHLACSRNMCAAASSRNKGTVSRSRPFRYDIIVYTDAYNYVNTLVFVLAIRECCSDVLINEKVMKTNVCYLLIESIHSVSVSYDHKIIKSSRNCNFCIFMIKIDI